MNYQEKKEELINRNDSLLKEYEILFYKTMRLAVDMWNLEENLELTPQEKIDWIMFNSTNEQMEKFVRLAAALQYVETPKDKDVINGLKENIKINNSKKIR